MTSKPPYEMAASGQSDSADTDLEDLSNQITVNPSPGVTVEASEEATLEVAEEESDESAYPLTPPPMSSATPPPSRRAPTLMGIPLPSLPLPGVTAARAADRRTTTTTSPSWRARRSPTTRKRRPRSSRPRPRCTRPPARTTTRLTTALSAQASVERERALRKSLPPSLDLPLPHAYGARLRIRGPRGLRRDRPGVRRRRGNLRRRRRDRHQQLLARRRRDEPSSELEAVLAPRRPTAALGSLGSGFARLRRLAGARTSRRLRLPRLPTPSPGFGGLSLPSPGQAPARRAPRSRRASRRRVPLRRARDHVRFDAGAANPGPLGPRGDDGRH